MSAWMNRADSAPALALPANTDRMVSAREMQKALISVAFECQHGEHVNPLDAVDAAMTKLRELQR